ncbi:hypothetical protein WD019_02010 [Fictibacillus sp. Mic-4]|uniref:hypothetical protein n=1 Tax=Fictibacillus TaxID=1329200 RepID=UPI00040EA2EE|nr:hypothetical protein [Fictibacillus gelatini]
MAVKVGNRVYKNIEQWQVDYIVKNSHRKLKEVGDEIKYLVVYEDELLDIDNVKKKIKEFTLGFPC